MDHKADIHHILSERRQNKNYFVRLKRTEQTKQLFFDAKCFHIDFRVLHSFEFVRVRCSARNSNVIYLPVDYEEYVSATRIHKEKASLTDLLINESKVWLIVVKKFEHARRDYNVGDLLQVRKGFVRRCIDWLKKTDNDRGTSNYLHTSVHPRKKSYKIPLKHLERSCMPCDSPLVRYEKLLAEIIKTEDVPFALTIPFDPFTCSAKRRVIEKTSENMSSYFERVIASEIQYFDVFLMDLGGNNNGVGSLSAVVVPQNVTFDIEYFDDASPFPVSYIEFDYDVIQIKLETLLLKLDLDDVTVVSLQDYSSGHINNSWKDINQQCFTSDEIEKQYTMNYKTHHLERDNKTEFTNKTPHDFPKDIHEDTYSDAGWSELEMRSEITSDGSGDIGLVNCSTRGIRNEYLAPYTELTNQYLRFKNSKIASAMSRMNEDCTLDNVVIGVDGYVQVNGGGGGGGEERREAELETSNSTSIKLILEKFRRLEKYDKCQIEFSY